MKSNIEYRDNTRLQRLIKVENHCVPCIVQNIKFQTLNFTRRKITKASQIISLIYSKSISMTYFWTKVVKEPVTGNFASSTIILFPPPSQPHCTHTVYKNRRANYTFMGMFRDDTKLCAHVWQTQITWHGDSRARHFPPRLSGHRPDYQRVIDSARLISRKLPGREAAERKCR